MLVTLLGMVTEVRPEQPTVGDGDGGKARATLERTTSNARHLACPVHVGYFLRYSDIALIFVRKRIILATTESNLQFRAIINVVVIDGNTIGILATNGSKIIASKSNCFFIIIIVY